VTSLRYPRPRAILSGEGSFQHGGRWNAIGSFRAVYGSLSDTVAIEESRAIADYYGVTQPLLRPRLLVAIRFRLARVLDFSTLSLGREEKATLAREDWRQRQGRGEESISQAIGRAAFLTGGEGMRVPSARVRDAINFIYFPGNVDVTSKAEVCEPEELDRVTEEA